MKIIFAFFLLLAGFDVAVAQTTKVPVDAMLILATDVSASIDDREFSLQRNGIISALLDEEVVHVLKYCNSQGIALTYVEWSGQAYTEENKQVVAWTHINTREDLINFAKEIEQAPRSYKSTTDVLSSLLFSASLFESSVYESPRKIIDVSSDGVQNITPRRFYAIEPGSARLAADVALQRDRLVSAGVMINAIVITNDSSAGTSDEIIKFYETNVRGGPGSFLIPVQNFEDYADGLKKKLIRELDQCMS